MHDYGADFKKFFPKFDFELKDFQIEAIKNTVEKDNTLCIMPTGGGKSVIYWMSAIENGGITIVVSPLVALISEQAESIREHGYSVLEFHGGISPSKQMSDLISFANGEIEADFIFVGPEKIAVDGLFSYCMCRRKEDIKLLVVDEVHCVSQWGMSFRPFYKRIPYFLDEIFGNNKWCRVLALTATLNPKELGDICNAFRISTDNIIKDTLLMRSEIQLHIRKFQDEKEKEDKFWDIVETHKGEKTLVYVYRKYKKHSVEDLCDDAIKKGYRAACFHGDMTPAQRTEIIDKYRNDEIDLIFATNAFGMGIDIKHIRVVIHFMIPESAEQYYQEVGRAARDGAGANAYLLYSNKNIQVKRTYFIDRSFPSEEKLQDVYKKIGKKKGLRVISYFEDDEVQQCLPYYMEAGLIEIAGKGFASFENLTDIKDDTLKQYFDSTKNKGFCMTLKRCGISAEELSDRVYAALVDGNASVSKPLSRWLVMDIKETEIADSKMEIMLQSIEEKKQYKHELLDYYVYIIENNADSNHLHQEIAFYLGMDKHQMARIHKTLDGNHVRSKSEVIICNMLYEAGIDYEYEKKLYYDDEHWIEPDFTIKDSSGKCIFWEHVGMLGREDYDKNWLKKLRIYNEYYPGLMVRTYESGNISQDAAALIDNIKGE